MLSNSRLPSPAFTTTKGPLAHPIRFSISNSATSNADSEKYSAQMTFLEARLSEAQAVNGYYASLSPDRQGKGSNTESVFGARSKDSEIEALAAKLRAPHALDALESAVKWAREEEAASEEFLNWAPHEDHKFGMWTPEGYHRLASRDKDNKFKFDYTKPLTEAEFTEHLKRGPGSGPTVFHAQKLLAKTKEIRKLMEGVYEAASTLRMVAKAGAVASHSGSRQGGITPAERKVGREAISKYQTDKPRG